MKSLRAFGKMLPTFACAFAFSGLALWTPIESAYGQSAVVSEKGILPRGTAYEMRKPEQWNGTLISDLDFAWYGASASDKTPMEGFGTIYAWLLDHGYAIAGTARRGDRILHYDPARELIDLVNVMDLFEAKFGKPTRTIQFGRSGGGHIALAMAETHPDRIDGAVALCEQTPVWQGNSYLDTWFTLQTLVAPTLPIVDIHPKTELAKDVTDSSILAVSMVSPLDPELTEKWKSALEAAQQTPVGRARIALAITIGQLPAMSWDFATTRIPQKPPISWDSITSGSSDTSALENNMYESLHNANAYPGAWWRFTFEQSGGGQMSWNTGIDYVKLFKQGYPAYQKATRELYAKAGGNLDEDLAKLNAAKRVEASPKAMKYWSAPGRTVTGEPKVPVLRVDGTHDPAIIPLMAGYEEAVKAHGFESLYRPVFLDSAGHCNYTVAEMVAAVETLVQRLDTGGWGDTSPEAMNKLAATIDPSSAGRFHAYKQLKYSRFWVPSVADYLGAGPGDQRSPAPARTK